MRSPACAPAAWVRRSLKLQAGSSDRADPRRGGAAREFAAHTLGLLEPATHEEQLVGNIPRGRKIEIRRLDRGGAVPGVNLAAGPAVGAPLAAVADHPGRGSARVERPAPPERPGQ